MEKSSSYREHVFLGYSSRKSLGNPISDVDFSDVFGGPPRSLIKEMRHSLGESRDSFSFRGGEETAPLRSNSWSTPGEKPVFGADSSNRRRQLGGDFFDDIFSCEDSLISTPRRRDRDPFSSTPASRNLSPARPGPPKFEPFGGGSSLPPQLSLSSKLAKEKDNSTFSTPCLSPVGNKDGFLNTFAFPSSPRTGLTGVGSETKLGQDCSRYDSRASYRQSPLSHEFSIIGDGSSKDDESARRETESQFDKDRNSSEVSSDNSQFHFSIYKWASKGVTLMMPSKGGKRSNSKERGKNESIVSGLPAPVLQGVNLFSLDENMSTSSAAFRFQYNNQDNDSSHDHNILMKDDIVEEPMPSKTEPRTLSSFLSNITEEPGRNSKLHSSMSSNSPRIGLCKHVDAEESQPKQNLDCRLNDNLDKTGKEMVRPAGEEVDMPKVNKLSAGNVDDSIKVKKRIGGKLIFNHAEATSTSSQVVMPNSEDKMHGNGVTGKVKEFVKIFNQEASPKLMCNVDNHGRSSRRKDLGAFKVEDSASLSTTKADGKKKMSNGHSSKKLTDAPIMVDQILKQTEMAHIDVNISAPKIHDSSSENNDISESCSEPNQEVFEAFDNLQESLCEDLHVNCLVEQLPEDQQKQQQTDQNQDEIQMSDAKIQQWSHGRDGNIRSLLSTLQYVLWPECGWKPVPLVDIIEGTSVKRAYQKALLCLHPDKLQQKGAAMHQKYIAEKVFEILQEAWDHFNSLSSV